MGTGLIGSCIQTSAVETVVLQRTNCNVFRLNVKLPFFQVFFEKWPILCLPIKNKKKVSISFKSLHIGNLREFYKLVAD